MDGLFLRRKDLRKVESGELKTEVRLIGDGETHEWDCIH